ncbi:MAG: Flp family type IVb pilin [Clostridiaceae bacterium]|nr:Flp family type IVb pilin [Clostridiaceae bacterium]
MSHLLFLLQQMRNNKKGQGMVEYGLIIGLVAIVVIGALLLLGQGLDGIFGRINSELSAVPLE